MKKRSLNTDLVLVFFISIFFSSCMANENSIELNVIKNFDSNKSRMLDVIEYVRINYYSLGSIKNLNRLQFILNDTSYQKGTIFSDDQVTRKLKNTIIYDVSFDKNSLCLEKFTFDEVRFKLEIKNANYQYYYVYEFCPLSNANVDNPNFKSVPLGSNWSLQIEKN